jgi:hypothetical protein
MAEQRGSSGPTRREGDLDPVPERVVAHAKAAYLRRTGGELAALVFDSLVDEATDSDEHRLRFEHPREHVEVLVSPEDGECSLRGRVEPAPARVELELEGGRDALVGEATGGDFAFDRVPRGLTRMILVGPPGSKPVHTDWFRT